MSTTLTDQIFAALAEFSSASRLYELKVGEDEEAGLVVEAFFADDGVQQVGTRDVIALSTDAYLELESLLGLPAALEIALADGTRERFAGEICEAAMLGSDGGLARYRIRICSWLWRVGQVRNCRVWQDKSVVEIVDAVFSAYQPRARWRWSDDTGPFLAEVSPRSYCCQYRESDLDFVQRLLADEGLCWRHEQTEAGPGLVLFADSSQRSAVPEDASSEALGGIRFHGARSVEESDSIQSLSAQRRLHASLTTVLSYDYKAKQVVAASSPSHYTYGKLPVLESFEVPGQYAYADWQQAQHYADLRMQEQEAHGQVWRGRSTVRTLRAGSRVQVLGAPLQQLGESASFTVLRVLAIGVNNMPPTAAHALAELFGPIPELLEELTHVDVTEDLELMIAQARGTGYANCFSAVSSELIWRPQLASDGRASPKPAAFGAQSAIVVGADGSDQPSGSDELYCDRLGRVRIRFHWQDGSDASCWVRVAQRSAGGGIGQQFSPRIGQELLVQFLENDIDRPIVVGALYNGRGEGGMAPTPGGRRDSETSSFCFEAANDHRTSGQANLSSGNNPVWHGASAESSGHRNPASQSGVRSKEFGGYGYSQLVFDDFDSQGRVQLKNTHAGCELNLGHLIYTADNYRGGLRGIGTELRTDHYGVVRTGEALLVSSYILHHNAVAREPTGQNAAEVALMKQAVITADIFNSAADIHESVRLATHIGSYKTKESKIDTAAAPLKALLIRLSGMTSSKDLPTAIADAKANNTQSNIQKVPQPTGHIFGVAAAASFGSTAGRGLKFACGELISLLNDGVFQSLVGGQLRFHAMQAIGFLAAAQKYHVTGIGAEIISAKDSIDIQAQYGEMAVQSKDAITVISGNSLIDLAAAKEVSLVTSGGAKIIVGRDGIKVACPGNIKIAAGKKSFIGAAELKYKYPELPRGTMRFDDKFQLVDPAGDPVKNVRYAIIKEDGGKVEGITDEAGMIPLQQAFHSEKLRIVILGKVKR
ncbi:type VI secretion system Vgr family protein [Massilia sp. IC2-476]|uniref:type VI secretion system Vgr family protein n=1 Tax=Massilia sp. IC2-476 TaxID=2887199 RepID=UPI001D124249|nr:type VI secretion system Vgr family protein [Massilia sp. IC2-476]MCC2970954.1 type VI secretion system tip protein VgrG [Massilia sp. IC2-476]